MAEVRAAGCVVWREGAGAHEVLLVHRPRYDDWSFPKGKLEVDESFREAAIREVEEETGCTGVLGDELDPVHYVDHKDRDKIVRYWTMAADPTFLIDEFEPNEEVDVLRWERVDAARRALSYDHDRSLLDQARGALRLT